MERERHHGNGGGDRYYFHHQHNQAVDRLSPERAPPSCSAAAGGSSVGVGGVGGGSYIEHRVSKMDTLAGIAIKYGVEVADIRRINNLVTDLQFFALKSLHIPLPGRHPPSPILSNGLDTEGPSSSEQTPPRRRHSDLFESFQSLKLKPSPPQRVSPAMSTLQGYYGLKTTDKKPASEGFEMAVYRKGGSHYLEDGPFAQASPLSNNPPLSPRRKSKSVANGFFSDEQYDDVAVTEARESDSDKWSEKLTRRHQKSEADFSSHTTPEMLLKEDNSSGGGFSAIKGGKGLALRPKAASRTASGVDTEPGFTNVFPLNLGDSLVVDGLNGVRKSSSTSSLQDQESSASSSSSIWPTSKWSLKPDAITRPIFDGLPKPMTGRRNKAALD